MLALLPKFLTSKKLAFIILLFFLISVLLSKPIQAFSTDTIRGGYLFNFEQAVFKTEEMNLQSFVNETFKATAFSIITSFVGCFSCTPEERQKNPGFIYAMGNFITGLYASPPASGVQYLAYLGNKIGIAQPVYAQDQGKGFQLMEPVRVIWTAFRNVSYIFFILIFVFIGFAIMFRVKISPQAVITIQSALPQIIIALILVTFSYAIVGFMIDLMYVFMALISNLFIAKGGIVESIPGIGGLITKLAEISTIFPDPITRIAVANSIFFFLTGIIAFIAALLMGPISWLVTIIVVILVVIAVIRCLWTILKAYTMIILSLIFAPFQILIGVLPGSNAIGSWFRNLLSNIAVLPAMITMFLTASYLILFGIVGIFTDVSTLLTTILSGWLNPLGPAIATVMILKDPMKFWDFFIRLILPIIGLMILLMAPKVSDMIQAFLAGKPFGYGAAIGEAMGPIPAVAPYGIGYGLQRAEIRARGTPLEKIMEYLYKLAQAKKWAPPP